MKTTAEGDYKETTRNLKSTKCSSDQAMTESIKLTVPYLLFH